MQGAGKQGASWWVSAKRAIYGGPHASWRWRLFALSALLLVVVRAPSQSANPDQFCYLVGGSSAQTCFDTRQDAEAAMRNDPAFAGAGQWLERIETPLSLLGTTPANPSVNYTYRIKERAPAASYTMYSADLGSAGSGGFGCAPSAGDPHPDYAGWCANEAALVTAAQQRWLATELAGCTAASTTLTLDRSVNASPFLEQDPNNPQRGVIRL